MTSKSMFLVAALRVDRRMMSSRGREGVLHEFHDGSLWVSSESTIAELYQYAALGSHHGMALLSTICFDRVLGLLAHTTGKLDDAAAHFEDALAFCRKAGYRPELAWSLCDYADTLLHPSTTAHGEHVEPGDRQKAMSLLDESVRILPRAGHAAPDGAGPVQTGDPGGVGSLSYWWRR